MEFEVSKRTFTSSTFLPIFDKFAFGRRAIGGVYALLERYAFRRSNGTLIMDIVAEECTVQQNLLGIRARWEPGGILYEKNHATHGTGIYGEVQRLFASQHGTDSDLRTGDRTSEVMDLGITDVAKSEDSDGHIAAHQTGCLNMGKEMGHKKN